MRKTTIFIVVLLSLFFINPKSTLSITASPKDLSKPRSLSDDLTLPDSTTSVNHCQPNIATGACQSSAYAKGQFILKFKASLTRCAHCLFQKRQQFAAALADGSDSLDRLNQQAGVTSITPLYPQWHRETTQEATAAYRQATQSIKSRFPRRTARAPHDAVLPDLTNIYVFEVPKNADIEALCAHYRQDPHVEYCQPNYQVKPYFIPNDPYYSSQGSWGQPYDDLWSLKADKLNLNPAWDITQGRGITVAVIDTGLDYNHPDIALNVWTNSGEIPNNGLDDDGNGFIDDTKGWDFAYNDNDPQDGYGHGTHVSGTIAAVGNNNLGIIGVAPEAKVMAVKGFDDSGNGDISALAQGIVYAAANGADVLNNSWGCFWWCPSNPVAEDAVRTAYGLGAVIVFSAGNNGDDVAHYSPQNMTDPKPIVVGATDQNDHPTFFTNFGMSLDVAAPGGGATYPPPMYEPFRNILSLKSGTCDPVMCDPNLVVGVDYLRQAGTSMAAPHAAGVAALVLANRPSFINEEVRQVLRYSADDISPLGWDPKTGTGRVDAQQALQITKVLTAEIITPVWGSSIDLDEVSAVTITGSANGTGFKQYQLFYGIGSTPTTWVPIGSPVTTPVSKGPLGTWVIDTLAHGPHLLRLVATSLEGAQFEYMTNVFLYREPLNIKQITTYPGTQLLNAISGNRIVWVSVDYLYRITADIYLYDLTTNTERRITADRADQMFVDMYPDIDGDRIVYHDYRNQNADIYLYDLVTNTERQITTDPDMQVYPSISGNRIVWSDNRNGNWDVYLYDLATNTERQITTDPNWQDNPIISGDRIVWWDERNGNWDVYLYDLATNTERRITTNPASQGNPDIDGDRIVWHDTRNGNADIYLFDLATNTERRLTTDPNDQLIPKIDGDRIVWEDNRNGNWDIYQCVYDATKTTPCQEQQITAHGGMQVVPRVSGNRIVWGDDRNGNWDIYMSEVPNSAPVLTPIGPKTGKEGTRLQFRVSATDPEGETLTYTASPLPAGAMFNAAIRTFYWTPTYNQAGTYPVTFTVSDGELTDSEVVTITVTDTPMPDLTITAVSGPTSAYRGMKITVNTTVRNQGSAASNGFSVGLYLSPDATITSTDRKLGAWSLTGLAAGTSTSTSLSIRVPLSIPAGPYYLGAIADATGLIKESDETNNTKAGNVIRIK